MSTASEPFAGKSIAAEPQTGAVKLTMILSGVVFALMMVLILPL